MRDAYLRDDVEVGDERRLQDDGDVGGVEQLDRVAAVLATVAGRLDGQVHTEALYERRRNWSNFAPIGQLSDTYTGLTSNQTSTSQ